MIRFILLPSSLILFPLLALAQAQPRINTPKEDPAAAANDTTAGRFSLTVYSTADPATFDPQDFQGTARDNSNQPIPGFGGGLLCVEDDAVVGAPGDVVGLVGDHDVVVAGVVGVELPDERGLGDQAGLEVEELDLGDVGVAG